MVKLLILIMLSQKMIKVGIYQTMRIHINKIPKLILVFQKNLEVLMSLSFIEMCLNQAMDGINSLI